MRCIELVHTAGLSFGLLSLGGAPTLADVLHDNGEPDNVNGYSNGTENLFGFRRALLDDFVVPAGESWTLEGFRWHSLWVDDITGTGAEILVWSDAGGIPGAPIEALNVTSYSEVATGRYLFSYEEVISWAQFDPVVLPAGHYWIELAAIGPQNNFWLTASPIQHSECWVNYEDMNGLEPGSDEFGVPADLAWSVEGIREILGDWACCFADGTCIEISNLVCEAQGGIALGAGVRCDLEICGAPGACCLPDNDCMIMSELFCDESRGTYGGIAVQCQDVQCQACATFLPEVLSFAGGSATTSGLADLDGDLDLDVVVSSFMTIRILLNAGDGSFGDPDEYNSGAWSYEFDLGDLDGDGDVDIVAAARNWDSIRVFRNRGDGTFQFGVGYDVESPGWIAIADLDGDLDLDAAVRSSEGVGVLLNDGTGRFGAPAYFPRPEFSSYIALGDLDGDLDADVALSGPDLAVMLNDGTGAFTPFVTYESFEELHRLTLRDLDGDEDLDVAASNDSDDPGKAIGVLLNDGTGAFAFDAFYAGGDDVSAGPTAFDLDDDDDLDLVVSNVGDDSLSVLLNNGDGTFAPGGIFPVGQSPLQPSVGDLDGDGDPDVAVPNGSSDDLSVVLNDCPFCPADLDGSGAVEFADILAILAAWDETGMRREDLDRSGVVDFGDLLVLLAAWGPCVEEER